MSLVRPMVLDNGVARTTALGDMVANSEAVLTLTNAAAQQLTAAQLASGILRRAGPVAGYADTFPTASDLIAALYNAPYIGGGAYSINGLATGLSFRFRFINGVAFANTVVAGTGVTLVGTTAIPSSSWKDYLITITNGTPPHTITVTTTNASNTLTSISVADMLDATVGAIVTGTGIPAGTTIIGVTTNTIVLSANATATGTVSVVIAPAYTVEGIGGGLN